MTIEKITTEDTAKSSEHQSLLDSLKGIAILAVLMVHSGGGRLPSIFGAIGDAGRYGVQLFFIISAFLAFKSFSRYINDNVSYVSLSANWIIKKIVRLIPVYFLAILLYLLIQGGNEYWIGSLQKITIQNVLSHITFTFGLFPTFSNSIIGVEWYLGALVIFYLIVPILFKIINSLEKSFVFLICGTFIFCGLSEICCRVLVLGGDDAYIYEEFWGTFSFIPQFPVMLLGIFLYFLCESNILNMIHSKKLISYALLGISVFLICGLVLNHNQILGISKHTMYGIAFFILIVSQKIKSCILLDNKFFSFFGKYSYPIYLLHMLLLFLYNKYIPAISDNLFVSWVVKYMVILISSTIISFFVQNFYDNYTIKLIKKFIRK